MSPCTIICPPYSLLLYFCQAGTETPSLLGACGGGSSLAISEGGNILRLGHRRSPRNSRPAEIPGHGFHILLLLPLELPVAPLTVPCNQLPLLYWR